MKPANRYDTRLKRRLAVITYAVTLAIPSVVICAWVGLTAAWEAAAELFDAARRTWNQ